MKYVKIIWKHPLLFFKWKLAKPYKRNNFLWHNKGVTNWLNLCEIQRGGGGTPGAHTPCIKSWFFTWNTWKKFAPRSDRRDYFKCAPPPNFKSWIRPRKHSDINDLYIQFFLNESCPFKDRTKKFAKIHRIAQCISGWSIRGGSLDRGSFQVLIRKACPWTILGNVFGECHAPYIRFSKDLIWRFRKKVGAL